MGEAFGREELSGGLILDGEEVSIAGSGEDGSVSGEGQGGDGERFEFLVFGDGVSVPSEETFSATKPEGSLRVFDDGVDFGDGLLPGKAGFKAVAGPLEDGAIPGGKPEAFLLSWKMQVIGLG